MFGLPLRYLDNEWWFAFFVVSDQHKVKYNCVFLLFFSSQNNELSQIHLRLHRSYHCYVHGEDSVWRMYLRGCAHSFVIFFVFLELVASLDTTRAEKAFCVARYLRRTRSAMSPKTREKSLNTYRLQVQKTVVDYSVLYWEWR